MHRIINFSLALILASSTSLKATSYFVSPSGNDSNDGLDSTTAWASIDNGDQLAILNPGDTINKLGGTYLPSDTVLLTISGTISSNIIYRRFGAGDVIIDVPVPSRPGIMITGSHITVENMKTTNGRYGILVQGDSCTVSRCTFYSLTGTGIRIEGHGNRIDHNVIDRSTGPGIRILNLLERNLLEHNTIFGGNSHGIEISDSTKTTRIFNNIIALNKRIGILSDVDNICAYNNVWGNLNGNYSGAVDSAGGISENPLFVDTAVSDFSLQSGSQCIDGGLDLGYPFNGVAPDMGAIESVPTSANQLPVLAVIGDKSVDEGINLNFGISAADAESTPVLSTSTLPSGASFIDNGDGTGTFDWTPTYLQSGVYNITFYAADDSSAVDSEVVSVTVNDVNRAPVLAAIGAKSVDEGQNLYFTISASDPDGTTPQFEMAGEPNRVTFVDNEDGTATFDFNPDFEQAGVYNVWFIAEDDEVADSELVTITVNDVNRPPVLYPIGPHAVEVGNTLTINLSSDDPDDTMPVISAENLPANTVFTPLANGIAKFEFTPDPSQIGLHSVRFIASDGALADSEQVQITVLNQGILSYVLVEWSDGLLFVDTTLSTDNDSSRAYCRGYDSVDSLLGDFSVSWIITGAESIGTVSPTVGSSTTLNLKKIGIGKVVAAHVSGIADTSGVITVTPGSLATLVISPDSSTVRLNDSVQFTVTGYDADLNVTAAGQINWKDIGRAGQIDSTGLFIATAPGAARVSALSSLGGIADTSGLIAVEELFLTTIAIGDQVAAPGEKNITALVFNVHNYFDTSKSLTGITVRDQSSGLGDRTSLLTNIDSVGLYLDINNDSILTIGDSLITKSVYADTIVTLNFPSLIIPPDSGRTFLVAFDINSYPRDGDTTNAYLTPASDITISDSTVVTGPAVANSFGHITFDGALASQIQLAGIGSGNLTPTDTAALIFSFDYPRNGYSVDTLKSLTVFNWGTATGQDIAKVYLYADGGNGQWDGAQGELFSGELIFTGDRWTLSGLSQTLSQPLTRYYIGMLLDSFPTSGATVTLGIPINGVYVSSGNDGPRDEAVVNPDVLIIQSDEKVIVSSITLPAGTASPGLETPPIVAIEFQNSRSAPLTVDSLSFTVYAVDPAGASQSDLDSQFDSVFLYIKNGVNFSQIEFSDSLLASTTVLNGKVTFTTAGLGIPAAGGKITLCVTSLLDPYNSKDGNLFDFGLQSATDVTFGQATTVNGIFPVRNPSSYTISTFNSSLVIMNTVPVTTLFGGNPDALVLDVELPDNGYANDFLTGLKIHNLGTLRDNRAVSSLKLWRDATGDGFTPDDLVLGTFSAIDDSTWVLTSLLTPLIGNSNRFFVTVEVFNGFFDGGTLSLAVPVGGIEYQSGADGPDDFSAKGPASFLVVPPNRITVVSVPAVSSQVSPAATSEQVLSFALYNGYRGEPKTLNALTLTNMSKSPAGVSYSDFELGQLSLYYDIDGNRILQNDSLLTIATFNLGALTFSGINLALPPESLSYFFVVADIALSLIDSDSLAVAIQQTADFDFLENVNTNGDIPLTRGGFAVADGSIKAQYEVFTLVSKTLSPGDTAILLYAFQPALNGNQSDTIQSITIDNLGNALSSDISSLELWLDLNGDSLWQATDVFVSPLSPSGALWVTQPIQVEVVGVAPTLFVVGDVSATATTNRTIHLRLPVNGCSYTSGNDGPLDSSLAPSGLFTITTSNLSVSLTPLRATYSLGQTITLEISVTNQTGSTLDSVLSRVVSVSDSTLTTLDSATTVTYGIADGLSSVFRYYLTPTQPGELFWLLQAVAPTTGDSSAIVQTELVRIEIPPTTVNVDFINSIPTAVIRGQENVFPFSVSITQPDSAGDFATVRMDSITIRLEDGAGVGSLANNVFSRITLLAGYANLVTLSSLPADSNIELIFNQPLLFPPGANQVLTVIVDIDSSSTMDEFRLSIIDANAILLIESNTAQPIAIGAGTQFPLSTAVCRIDDPADKMMLYFADELSPEVNYGQQNVKSLKLLLRHPGGVTNSQIQVTDITIEFLDELGSLIIPSTLVNRVSVSTGGSIIGDKLVANSVDTFLQVTFNSPFTLSPGQRDSLQILVSIAEVTTHSMFGLRIQDSSSITVRDLSSGKPVPVTTDTSILSSTSVFPIVSGIAELKGPALPPEICVTSSLNGSLAAGKDSVGLIDMTLTYSSMGNYSPLRIDAVRIFTTDSLGFLIDANRLFDRIGIMFPDSILGVVNYQPFVLQQNNYTVFSVNPKLLLYPGDTVSMRLVGDIEADAIVDHFMLSFDVIGSLDMADNSDTTRQLGYLGAPTCAENLPFVSTAVGIFLPAGQPRISPIQGDVRIATQGERSVELEIGDFIYESIGLQGDITITGAFAQILSRSGVSLVPFEGAKVFERVTLVIDNDTASIDSIMIADSARFAFPAPIQISAGESRGISLFCDILPNAPVGNYQIRFVDSASISLQDVNLGVGVILSNTQAVFPLATPELSVVATDLANSFSNYPNPFNPSSGQITTFVYVLSDDATVDVELFTLTGELVYTIASKSLRSAGAHQSDQWRGLNDIGLAVIPGVYVCRIVANYTSGKTEELTRKVAVIR